MKAQKEGPGNYLGGALHMRHIPGSFPSDLNRSLFHRVTQDIADAHEMGDRNAQ